MWKGSYITMDNIFITSMGYYIPGGRLTNEDVLQRVEEANKDHLAKEDLELILYGDSRKFEFLGIETRSLCLVHDDENAVAMACGASLQALEKAGMKARQIDCLIVCGVTNPFREPSFALVLAKKLGMEASDYFDINDTCNGFMKSVDVAAQYMKTGKYRHIMIVSCESPYEIAEGLGIDYRLNTKDEADNKFSTLIVGSGAAAMILSVQGNGRKIRDYCEKKETLNWDASLFTVPNIFLPDSETGERSRGVWTDARLISARVIKEMPVFILKTLQGWGMTLGDVDLLVMHQLGNNVTFATLDALQLSHDRVPVNTFKECGNMASANIPVNLALAEEQGKLKKGDSVLLASSACGLSYSLTHIEW
jgi:3-oxoacyl-[acyl-carrier-protein] synthase-3